MYRLIAVAVAGVFAAVSGDDEQRLFRHIFPTGVLVDIADMMDGPAHRVKQRCAAAGEVLLLRHGRHLAERQPVVNDNAVVAEENRGNQRFARFLLLLGDHGVKAADGVCLQPCHRPAAIQNKNQFRHKKALLRLPVLSL